MRFVRSLSMSSKELLSPAFGELDTNRKVPVIVDNAGPDSKSFTLWESGAILIYLAENGTVPAGHPPHENDTSHCNG